MKGQPMKVKDLLNLLSTECNDDDVVFLWVDGNRYELDDIDNMGDKNIDLNAKIYNEGATHV
jgi:hypothetical protein